MCGICGIHEYARQGTPRLEPIETMTDALAHRGPDGAGTWCAPRLALGHRRLSIFDLSAAGLQPMHSADGLATVVFNGEIYNYRELRADHERRGHRFRSGTDTEVLLEHYRLHGPRALDDFRGMFAFALWDAARDVLVVARDRLGVKPLYWWDRDGTFLFASELTSLLRHPDVRAELDRSRLAEWYALRFTPAPGSSSPGITSRWARAACGRSPTGTFPSPSRSPTVARRRSAGCPSSRSRCGCACAPTCRWASS
jgi:asparagine synthase (glutamine-hydrolysing)